MYSSWIFMKAVFAVFANSVSFTDANSIPSKKETEHNLCYPAGPASCSIEIHQNPRRVSHESSDSVMLFLNKQNWTWKKKEGIQLQIESISITGKLCVFFPSSLSLSWQCVMCVSFPLPLLVLLFLLLVAALTLKLEKVLQVIDILLEPRARARHHTQAKRTKTRTDREMELSCECVSVMKLWGNVGSSHVSKLQILLFFSFLCVLLWMLENGNRTGFSGIKLNKSFDWKGWSKLFHKYLNLSSKLIINFIKLFN